MSSIIFSTAWVPNEERLKRHQDWLTHHLPLLANMDVDRIVWVDNASPIELLSSLGGNIYNAKDGLQLAPGSLPLDIYRCDTFLDRSATLDYPYCWRGMHFLQDYVIKSPQLQKIIILDTDFYVLSQYLCNHLKTGSTGWEAMWCDKYSFPESAFNIINKDSIHLLLNFPIPSYTYYSGQMMEKLMPYSTVHRTLFKGDRYGELNFPQESHHDWYGQHMPGGPSLTFNPRDRKHWL